MRDGYQSKAGRGICPVRNVWTFAGSFDRGASREVPNVRDGVANPVPLGPAWRENPVSLGLLSTARGGCRWAITRGFRGFTRTGGSHDFQILDIADLRRHIGLTRLLAGVRAASCLCNLIGVVFVHDLLLSSDGGMVMTGLSRSPLACGGSVRNSRVRAADC